jgi:hypothetical protein
MVYVRRFAIGFSALALGLAVGASAAAARGVSFKISTYKVTYEGSGSYSVKQSDGPSHLDNTADFHWKVKYLLVFINQKGHQVAAISTNSSSGGGGWTINSDNGGGEVCTHSGGLKLNKMGSILGVVQKTSGKVIMHLIPGANDFATTNGGSGSDACSTSDYWHDWVGNFSHVGTSEESIDPLTAFVTLSKKELGFGKVVVNVSNHTLAAPSLTVVSNCGSGNGASCTQSYDWKGTVTFVKKR